MSNRTTRGKEPARRLRRVVRWGIRLLALAILVLLGLILFWLRDGIYNRWVRYPREAAAWEMLRFQHRPVTDNAGWTEYRGILHSHSHLSHDSEVSFEEIRLALEGADLDFICLSDHCDEGRADFSAQWRGIHDGKLFIPGFEMKEGIMPFGVRAGVVLSNQTDSVTLTQQIVREDGLLFYAHPEEQRDWDCPRLTGMEIYNLHTDFKRVEGGVMALLPDLLLNQRRYPDHIYRSVFRRPVEFLRRWDELNRTRHITGIAANDCHQNVGYRAYYQPPDRIRIEDTSPETIREIELNAITRPLALLSFGVLQPDRALFHVQLDPYERSARFVNTHVLTAELSEAAVLDALRAGRVFIGFNMIADSSGFRWFARNPTDQRPAVMGESLAWTENTRLHALSPLPCRFTIVQDGNVVHQAEGRTLEWSPPQSGKYRVEGELKVLEDWVPWVYTNPIELR